MLRKLLFLTIILAVGIGIAYYMNVSVVRNQMDEIISISEQKINELKGHRANAIRQARKLLDEKLKSGYDLENRPCLAEEIVPGWAIDIVHQPIEEVDMLEINQCQSYLEGKVENIILMDEFGHQIKDGIKLGF